MFLGQQYDLRDEEYIPTLQLRLYHKGQYDFSETPLGKVLIDLTTIDTSQKDMWYPLQPDARATDVTGEVHLRLKFNLPAGTDEEAPMIQKSAIDVALESDTQLAASVEDQSPNTIKIKLICGRNLEAANFTITK
jgi:hypothetical protein